MAEKNLNELAPDLRRLYSKAVEAAQRENFDYATTLFCQVLQKEPGLFEARKALRAAQTARSAGASTGFFKKMMSNAGSSPQITKAKITLNKNPAEAMAIAAAHGYPLAATLDPQTVQSRLLPRKPSLLQDFEAGRPMELASIVQAPLAFARSMHVDTPTLDTLAAIVLRRARDRGLVTD